MKPETERSAGLVHRCVPALPLVARSALPFLLLASGSASAQIAISPIRTRLAVEPGEHALQRISVHNTSDSAVRVTALLRDWDVEEPGTVQDLRYHDRGTLPNSCGDSVFISPDAFLLAPGAVQEISLSVIQPEDASGSCHIAMVARAEPPGSGTSEEGVSIDHRLSMGHLVIVDAKDTARWAAEVEAMEVGPPLDTGPIEVQARIRNTGTATMRVSGSVLLLDASGTVLAKRPSEVVIGFAGRTATTGTRFEKVLGAGHYKAVGVFEVGPEVVLSPETAFEVVDRLELAEVRWPRQGSAEEAGVRLVLENPGHVTHVGTGTATIERRGSPPEVVPLPEIAIPPGATTKITVPPFSLIEGDHVLQVHFASATAQIDASLPFTCNHDGTLVPSPATPGRPTPTGASEPSVAPQP